MGLRISLCLMFDADRGLDRVARQLRACCCCWSCCALRLPLVCAAVQEFRAFSFLVLYFMRTREVDDCLTGMDEWLGTSEWLVLARVGLDKGLGRLHCTHNLVEYSLLSFLVFLLETYLPLSLSTPVVLVTSLNVLLVTIR